MKTVVQPPAVGEVRYPDSDGKPMGETPRHIRNMFYALYPLERRFEKDDEFFVAANMFVYYVKGDPKKHVSPDVFAVRGVPKERTPERRKYLVWVEGKSPDVAIEMTSESTRDEDLEVKMEIYQDVLKVQEYFLFDPWDEYLVPRLQGYRLAQGLYQPIAPEDGRLPSQVLGLHLEADGELLRFFDPVSREWLPIPPELAEAQQRAEADRLEAEAARQQVEQALQQIEAARNAAIAAQQVAESAVREMERLRHELEELRSKVSGREG